MTPEGCVQRRKWRQASCACRLERAAARLAVMFPARDTWAWQWRSERGGSMH